jgi:hypothetical protein
MAHWFGDAETALAVIGVVWLALLALRILGFFWLYCLRPRASLAKYGAKQGSWALVTGASEGARRRGGVGGAVQLRARRAVQLLIERGKQVWDWDLPRCWQSAASTWCC